MKRLLGLLSCAPLPVCAYAQTGTIGSTSPCTITSGGHCSVTVNWTKANAPIACVWIAQSPPALFACSTASADQAQWPWTNSLPASMELRAHSDWPGNALGWPDTVASVYSNAPLLASTPIYAGLPVVYPPSVSIGASPAGGLIAPATVTLNAAASDSDGYVIQVDYYYGQGSYLGSAYSPPYALTISGITAGTFDVYGMAYDNTGLKSYSNHIAVSVQSAQQPAVQPIVVHATQLTANCAEQYCIKITGFQFAADAYVELRRDSAYGPVVAQFPNPARSKSGDASALEVALTDPSLRSLVSSEPGLWVYVVNPGNPSATAGGLNVVRDSGYSLKGLVETVDANRISGWVCSDMKYGSALSMKVRLDSDSGTQYVSAVANLPRPDIANSPICGNTGAHGFDVFWPGSWKTGQTRDVFVVAELPYVETRYPRALIDGAPRRVAFQSIPLSSAVVSQNVEAIMAGGSAYSVGIRMRNTGNAVWQTSGFAAVALGLQGQSGTSWGITRVPLAQNLAPDQETTFNFVVTAPSVEGLHNFQWQLLTGTNAWFGTVTPNIQVRVLIPPSTYPVFTFPTKF